MREPASRSNRGNARLTPRGWAWVGTAALLLAFGYGWGRVGLLHAGYLLACLPVVAWLYLVVVRPHFDLARRFTPSIVQVGEPTRVALRIVNIGGRASPQSAVREVLPWPAFGDATLPLPPTRPAHRVGGSTSMRREGGSAIVGYTIRPPRRGVAAIGPLSVEIRDPFGLVRLQTYARRTDRLIVTPAIEPLSTSGILAASGEGDRLRTRSPVGGREDQQNTREYRAGDPLNRVHWRVSARHGELMVRQEERHSSLEARILLETRRVAFADHTGESDSFEWAVRMVASLDAHLAGLGYSSRVVETAAPQLAVPGPGSALLVALAGVQLRVGSSNALPADTAALRGDRTGPIFAIMSSPDAATVDWLAAMPRPGVPAVAFLFASRGSVENVLARAGWTCVPVTAATRLDDAWAKVDRDVVRA